MIFKGKIICIFMKIMETQYSHKTYPFLPFTETHSEIVSGQSANSVVVLTHSEVCVITSLLLTILLQVSLTLVYRTL